MFLNPHRAIIGKKGINLSIWARIKKIANDVRLDSQTAIESSHARLGAQGSMLVGAIGLVFLSFIILAIVAPLGAKTGGLLSYIISFIPFLILIGGLFIAIRGLYLTFKNQTEASKIVHKGAIAKTAIEIALSEIIDAGLLAQNESKYSNCLSGNVHGFAIVSLQTNKMGFCVIRLKEDFKSILIALPRGEVWPIKLPTDKKLSPVTPPINTLEAWSFDNLSARDKAQNLIETLTPTINMAQMGGELPFICVQDRALIIGFKNADLGAISLIGNEAARCLAAP